MHSYQNVFNYWCPLNENPLKLTHKKYKIISILNFEHRYTHTNILYSSSSFILHFSWLSIKTMQMGRQPLRSVHSFRLADEQLMKAAKQLVGTFNIHMKNGLVIKTELLNYMRMWRFLDSKTVVKLTLTHTQRKSQTHLVSMMKWTHTWVHANKICKMNENPHIISATHTILNRVR